MLSTVPLFWVRARMNTAQKCDDMTDLLTLISTHLVAPATRLTAPFEGRWRLDTVDRISIEGEEVDFLFNPQDTPELFLLEFRGDTLAEFVYCPQEPSSRREFTPYTFNSETGMLHYNYAYQRILEVTDEHLILLMLDGLSCGVLQRCAYRRIG